ncbi:uncharacterized protein LTHEOB_9022 [Neofusicoccum parvum]|uniref:Uncharacterized protein LTHEOB_9022 n=1 Tax=Neofusicoccum parvum TaxID=310453 RepID=A0ACB5SL69_9PEZI|nr:uncharacterized protein LTHEOB_9022 [Neofusicoccum parvum]
MHLQVHVGPYPKVPVGPKGKVKSDASQSASYAQSIKPASIFEVFTDGSVCGDMAGYAAAWRDPLPAHPNHYAHQSGQLQRAGIASSEAELRSINLGLDSAHNWRDRALHRSVIVYSDNAVNLKLVRDWQEGVPSDRPLDPHVEHVLVRMKYWAALLHQQGVEVTLRWMKSRRDIDGHDIADIWSKVRSGARPGGKRWLWQRDSDLRWHIYQWRREENANPALRLALAQFKEEVVNAPPQ